MFGTAGGLTEFRSAQLANRGIASLALAYFGYKDLPDSLDEFYLDYFERAVQILLEHPQVSNNKCASVCKLFISFLY